MSKFKLTTWNMEGSNNGKWNDVRIILKQNNCMCVQECGTVTYKIEKYVTTDANIYDFGDDALLFRYEWGDSNNRCSLGIVMDKELCNLKIKPEIIHKKELRPMIGLCTTSGVWVYSYHAPSGNDNAAKGVTNSMLSLISSIKSFVCAGDFNCPPNFLQPPGSSVASSGKPTRKKRCLDYAVYSGKLKVTEISRYPGNLSDHIPVQFEVNVA